MKLFESAISSVALRESETLHNMICYFAAFLK